MPYTVSLNARRAANAEQTELVPVVLMRITHPSLSKPVLLSTDPTERITSNPLAYGTRHYGNVYSFLIVEAILPDDEPKSSPSVTLAFENVADDMAAAIRSITPGTYASVDLFVVFAKTPDIIERAFFGLRGVHATYDAAQVALELSREPLTSEPCPSGRMTVNVAPGVHP